MNFPLVDIKHVDFSPCSLLVDESGENKLQHDFKIGPVNLICIYIAK